MIEREFRTILKAAPDRIWASATTFSGINYELMPYLSMHGPPGVESIDDLEPIGDRREFMAAIRLANLVSLKTIKVSIVRLETRMFVEESQQPGMKFWRHRRSIAASREGALLVDRLRFEPRVFADATSRFVDRLFRHRHRKLEAYWNKK